MAKKKETATEPTLQLKDVPASIAGYAAGPMFYARLVRDFPNETLGEDGVEAMLAEARTALDKEPDEIMANAMADWPQFVVNYRAWIDERQGKRAILAEAKEQGFTDVVVGGVGEGLVTEDSADATSEVERSCFTCVFGGTQDEDPCTRADGYCSDDTLEFWTAREQLHHTAAPLVDSQGNPVDVPAGDAAADSDSPSPLLGPEPRTCEHCGEETTDYIVTPTEQVFCHDGDACRERKRLQEEKAKADGKRVEKVVEQHRVKLTTEEMKALADRTAENLRRKADLEQQKAQSTKSYAQKIGEVEAELHKDGALYREGHEMRDVECQVIKDYRSGWVTTIRLDTMEETHRRRLRHDEAQIPLPIETATPGDLATANIGGTYGTNPHPGGELVEEHTPGDDPVVEEDARSPLEVAMDAAAEDAPPLGVTVRPDCHGGDMGPQCGDGESLCSFYDECRALAALGPDNGDMPPMGSEDAGRVQEAV